MDTMGKTPGTGPRADQSLKDLDPDLPVLVEIIGGNDSETGHTVVHDADYYQDHPEDIVQSTFADARQTADELCCDCFETAWIETMSEGNPDVKER